MLYVVSTPIGNLKDITLRALDVLNDSEIIIAEDTRRAGVLLSKYSIKNKKLISFNDFNKEKRTPAIIDMLKQGEDISLVSDAGTPGISDPGFYLTRECIKEHIQVIPVPGATALAAGLIGSGFATDSFIFYGFISKKEKAKKDFFETIKDNGKTTILYESPHRLVKTLALMNDVMPDRKIFIARELTKKFEEFIRGNVEEVYDKIKGKNIKGEITIVLDK